jgi:hypothetical protein
MVRNIDVGTILAIIVLTQDFTGSSEVDMRTWREKFQAMAMAVAFAEEGEWETARNFLKEPRSRTQGRTADLKKRPERRLRQDSYRA